MKTKLYKYREYNSKNLSALEKNQLWCCKPYVFNDPFDSRPLISKNTIRDFVKIHNIRKTEENYDIFLKILIYLIKFTQNLLYVCSLSENSSNPAMWSHYCKQYTGYVVEYEFELKNTYIKFNNSDIDASIEKVVYCKERPDFENCLLNMALELLIKHKNSIETQFELAKILFPLYLSKSNVWSYEKERRIIIYKNGRKFDDSKALISIPVKAKCVYVGYRMPYKNYIKLKEICIRNGIKMYCAYPVPFVSKYKINMVEITEAKEKALFSEKHFF